VLAALTVAPGAAASGGTYVFDGGTSAQRLQVREALDASSFPWGLVPGPVTIHLGPGLDAAAVPGQIWVDSDLLTSGRYAWGVIQHEYAHQVDFALLDDAARARFMRLLGGRGWLVPTAAHDAQAAERFADTLAAVYWPSPDNCAHAFARPAAFRELASSALGLRSPAPTRSGTGAGR
jgi:hypothetical protein